jgi:hypothetical protein
MKNSGAGLDHLQACQYCPRYTHGRCSVYESTDWVNRQGGCGFFPERDMPPSFGRVGQQKQKHQDRAYSGKNDGRRKYRD